jgi:beta-lactam-binding protein with PASTA domain/predicted Ser/Thr protein kinase
MTTSRLLSDRYELGEVLGYGGMSEVHRGLDTRLGRDVAIKVLRADLARDPQFQMRFRREAQNSAALNHPAIVSVYDTGEVAGEMGPLPYIVMEYVDGQTLREIVKTTGPMTQQKVLEVMADVCAALDFSHRHQIIHRDVKPANIMITRGGAVKVMDFGIARALGEGQNVTQTAAVIGTAQYLSPEQAKGEAVDARSDVYAAGCVLYELLTGEPPFTGDTPVAVAYQHVREDPKPPSDVNPQIPPALDAVILKALSKNPANRYQSAAELRADLVRVRNGQAPMAPSVMSEDERTAMLAPAPTAATRRTNGRHGPPTGSGPVTEYGYYDEAPRRTGRVVLVTVAVAVALGIVGFVVYVLLSPPAAPKTVAVPANLTGATEQEARNAISQAGLRIGQVTQVESTVDQTFKIVSSDPAPGSQVAERTTVNLSVGKGPAEVTVPKLAGEDANKVGDELTAVGLVLGTTTPQETADSTKIGKVIKTDPEPGVKVEGGSKVDVVVGTKQTSVTVPDLKGQKDLQAAGNQLFNLGLKVNPNAEAVDGSADEGSIESTDPPANSKVAPGTQITIQVSKGNRVEMPNVVGQQPQQAQQTLGQLGLFNVEVEEKDIDDPSKDNKVISQSVDPKDDVDPDDKIKLVFGNAPGGANG